MLNVTSKNKKRLLFEIWFRLKKLFDIKSIYQLFIFFFFSYFEGKRKENNDKSIFMIPLDSL